MATIYFSPLRYKLPLPGRAPETPPWRRVKALLVIKRRMPAVFRQPAKSDGTHAPHAPLGVLAILVAAFTASSGAAARTIPGGRSPNPDNATSQSAGFVEERPIRWSLSVSREQLTPGSMAFLWLSAEIEDGWYLNAFNQPEAGLRKLEIALESASGLRTVGKIGSPRPRVHLDAVSDRYTYIHREDVTFTLPVRVDLDEGGDLDLGVLVTYQACNNQYCLAPRTERVSAVPRPL